MDQLPRLGKRELICLLLFTCNYVVSVWRVFLFLWVLGMGYVILLWHSLSLPYNCFKLLSVYNFGFVSLDWLSNLGFAFCFVFSVASKKEKHGETTRCAKLFIEVLPFTDDATAKRSWCQDLKRNGLLDQELDSFRKILNAIRHV